jgi:hypothetical protein
MTLAHQTLLMLVLLISGSVAVMPFALREFRPQPSPPLRAGSAVHGLWIVQTPRGRWLINGTPTPTADLQSVFRRRPRLQRVHYLPSDSLPMGEVSRSLRQLRQLAPASVVLELSPPGRSLGLP